MPSLEQSWRKGFKGITKSMDYELYIGCKEGASKHDEKKEGSRRHRG